MEAPASAGEVPVVSVHAQWHRLKRICVAQIAPAWRQSWRPQIACYGYVHGPMCWCAWRTCSFLIAGLGMLDSSGLLATCARYSCNLSI
eukprot:20800-Pelagomonas_calceolata.AAC.1